MITPVRRRARKAAEQLLRSAAKPVRRLLLAANRDEAPTLPEIVQIESTNLCNAKCVFCPRDEMARTQGIMDMALFQKIADECAHLGITHIRMHNYGEAFMDRLLVDKVRYAKRLGIPEVGLISNGSLLTETAARGMIDAGLDAINISVDAAGKDVFEKTRVNLSYDKVIANIERLIRLRDERGQRRPEADSLVRAAGQLGRGTALHRSLAEARRQDSHHRPAQLGRHAQSGIGRQFPCYRPWLTFTVLWDGRVSLCCADFDGREILGDLRTSTIREVWNNDAYRAARRAHLDHGGPAVCQSCDLPKKDSPLWVSKLV